MAFYVQNQAAVSDTQYGYGDIEWEECGCLGCGSEHWSPVIEAPDPVGSNPRWFLIVQCDECGLCFTNPRPRLQSMAQFYAHDYGPHRPVSLKGKTRSWRQRVLPPWLGLAHGQEQTLAWHGQGRLLDFGCGSGSFLLRMHREGWQAVGVDNSFLAMQHLSPQPGLDVLSGTLPHPALEGAHFDVITMWQSLEHVHDPLEVLRAAHRLLAPAGKLVVAVPNIDSLPFRIFGKHWNGLDLPRHLVHFTPASLSMMLMRAGFRVGPVRMVRRTGWIRASARAASQAADATFLQRWLKRRLPASLASWYGYFQDQADCILVVCHKNS